MKERGLSTPASASLKPDNKPDRLPGECGRIRFSNFMNNHPPAKPVVFPMRAKPSVPRTRVKHVNSTSHALWYNHIGVSSNTIPPSSPCPWASPDLAEKAPPELFPGAPSPTQGGLTPHKQLSWIVASLVRSRSPYRSPPVRNGGVVSAANRGDRLHSMFPAHRQQALFEPRV